MIGVTQFLIYLLLGSRESKPEPIFCKSKLPKIFNFFDFFRDIKVESRKNGFFKSTQNDDKLFNKAVNI